MDNRREHLDLKNEDQLEQLLKSGYAAPALSAEFQETLLRQLDQEFVRIYPSCSPTSGDSVSNDTALEPVSPSRPRRFIGLRMAVTMAVGASLLFAVALWNHQNAYGWASMLHAMEQCGWVQATSEPDAENRNGLRNGLSGWVSSRRGVVAVRSEQQVAFYDHQEQISSRYLSDRQVIYQEGLPASQISLGPEELFYLLLSEQEGDGPGSLKDYRVVAESWRSVAPREGRPAAIELRVALREMETQGGSSVEGKTYKLLVLLDPETQLPTTCRLLTRDRITARNFARSFDFTYPKEGPDSIFALGVPAETEVVASLANLEKESGKESEITHLAAKSNEKNPSQTSQQKKVVVQGVQAGEGVQAEEIVVSSPAAVEPWIESDGQADDRLASNPPQSLHELPALVLPEKALPLEELVEQVNAQLRASWQDQGITVAERANDTEFLRRVYLDLTGRIPRVSEVYGFLEETPQFEGDLSIRRQRLVDDLLASRDHATHLATVWRKLLLPERVAIDTYGGTAKFDRWLADRFEKNLPYDQLVRQLLLAEGRVSDSGPILFYAALKLNPEELAAKTARTFLGMRMECAQCHDHPFDDSISQEDFWAFAAHFAQISRPRGKIEMTSSVLRVRDNRRGEVMLPDSEEVVPPRLPYRVPSASGLVSQESPQKKTVSRRKALVDWLTTTQNRRFARATVNRVWQHLFGLGLVEAVDDMRADNRAICPEVLDTLSLDFAASGYDLRRLLRALVLSDAYQLSSRGIADDPSQTICFARMNIKSFTADQLYDCINIATQSEAMPQGNGMNGGLIRFGNTPRQAFIEQFQAPPGQRTDYHAGIPQALTLMHGHLIHGATDLASSGLLQSLNAPFFSDEQRIKTLFLSTLSRFPDEKEQEKMLAYLQAALGDQERSKALGDILWALLNSAEFTFIH